MKGPVVPPAELNGRDWKVAPLRKLLADQPAYECNVDIQLIGLHYFRYHPRRDSSPRLGMTLPFATRHSEEPVHDVQADAAEGRVGERLGNGPDDLESKCLPESHGGVVRCHDRVELHRGVPLLFGPGECVLAERAPNSAPPRVGSDHEAGRGHVRAWTGTIRSHLRRPEHPRSLAGDDGVSGRRLDPDLPRLLARP